MIDKHMVQWCFLLCNNYAQPYVMFDTVMQVWLFSLLCISSIILYWEGVSCWHYHQTPPGVQFAVGWSLCVLFSSPHCSVTWFIKLSFSVICSVLSSVLRRSVLLLAQQGWETLVMALQSDSGSVKGRGALHILQCCQQAACGMAVGKEPVGAWQLFCLRGLLLSKPAHCTCGK